MSKKDKYIAYCNCGRFRAHVVSLKKGICLECKNPLRPEKTFKERMDADIMRVTGSLLNLLKRRYPDNWREMLKKLLDEPQDVVV